MKLLIKNIGELIQVEIEIKDRVLGKKMKDLDTLKDAYLLIENGLISDFGPMRDISKFLNDSEMQIEDAKGGMVFPSWIDSHSHLVFASSRESEFVDRIQGLSYQEIAQKGGGILNSAKKLSLTSEEELYQSAAERLRDLYFEGHWCHRNKKRLWT